MQKTSYNNSKMNQKMKQKFTDLNKTDIENYMSRYTKHLMALDTVQPTIKLNKIDYEV